ncbi:hypothetical protein PBI_BEAGLE_130 [Arthrobacter phage Beagle]|nr:hypothetical protein PBI_BEAGLE_130 [Arthrobacter phage Beagle]
MRGYCRCHRRFTLTLPRSRYSPLYLSLPYARDGSRALVTAHSALLTHSMGKWAHCPLTHSPNKPPVHRQ